MSQGGKITLNILGREEGKSSNQWQKKVGI
jgi:hypothetical protein